VAVILNWKHGEVTKCIVADACYFQMKFHATCRRVPYTTLDEFIKDPRIEPLLRKAKLQKLNSI
jgi:hypothetical protein